MNSAQVREIIEQLQLNEIPTVLDRIIAQEPILCKGNNYGDAFDGRLEYHEGQFLLFYNTRGLPTIAPRTRFSIAHELAHYFIDEHRSFLVKGDAPHNSQAEFREPKTIEREADELAANILMPEHLFSPKCANGDIKTLLALAKQFETSIRSTAMRFSLLNRDPCAIVVSANKKIRYSRSSEDLEYRRLGYFKNGAVIPTGSVTQLLVDGLLTPEKALDGRPISVMSWTSLKYENHNTYWEQALMLGNSGECLTTLFLEDSSDSDE